MPSLETTPGEPSGGVGEARLAFGGRRGRFRFGSRFRFGRRRRFRFGCHFRRDFWFRFGFSGRQFWFRFGRRLFGRFFHRRFAGHLRLFAFRRFDFGFFDFGAFAFRSFAFAALSRRFCFFFPFFGTRAARACGAAPRSFAAAIGKFAAVRAVRPGFGAGAFARRGRRGRQYGRSGFGCFTLWRRRRRRRNDGTRFVRTVRVRPRALGQGRAAQIDSLGAAAEVRTGRRVGPAGVRPRERRGDDQRRRNRGAGRDAPSAPIVGSDKRSSGASQRLRRADRLLRAGRRRAGRQVGVAGAGKQPDGGHPADRGDAEDREAGGAQAFDQAVAGEGRQLRPPRLKLSALGPHVLIIGPATAPASLWIEISNY